jgi:hypothetical protein
MAVVFGVCERRAVITSALSFGFSFAFGFAIRLGDRPRCRFPRLVRSETFPHSDVHFWVISDNINGA